MQAIEQRHSARRESEACPLAGVEVPRFGAEVVRLDPAQIHSRRESDGGWVGRFLVREESTHTPPRRGSERTRERVCELRSTAGWENTTGQIGLDMVRIQDARLALR